MNTASNAQPSNAQPTNALPLTMSHWAPTDELAVEELTVGDMLRSAVASAPDRIGLMAGVHDPAERRTWTYTELLDDAERCARALLARFEPGERVAIWAPNVAEWLILELGAGGAVSVLAYNSNDALADANALSIGGAAYGISIATAEANGSTTADHLGGVTQSTAVTVRAQAKNLANADADAVSVWLHEARAVSRLSHPNIVPVFEADVIDGQSALVLEYVDGGTLSEARRGMGPMPTSTLPRRR